MKKIFISIGNVIRTIWNGFKKFIKKLNIFVKDASNAIDEIDDTINKDDE